ncbi:MAG: extracellular solute-binding protein, partial [Clostridiales bacterium]|nr:extracellular solute-binding protein [Clostridiales bacterium]
MKKAALLLFLSLLSLCLLAGCASGGSKKVTIRFATQSIDQNSKVLPASLEQLKKDYPNMVLEVEESPGNDLITKINTDIMGDNTPDIFTFWRPEAKWSVDKYIEMGALADLSELKNDPEFKDLFADYAWRTATVDGKVWCIPRFSFFVEFLVNKTVFEANGIPLPTDWSSLVNATSALKNAGVIPWAIDTKEGLDDSSRLFNAIINRRVGNAKGLELLQGIRSFTEPDVVAALDLFIELAANNAPPDASSLDLNQVISKYLNTGKAGMVIGHAGQINPNLTDEAMEDLIPLSFPLTPDAVISAPSAEQDLTNLVYISAKAFADPEKKPILIEFLHRLCGKAAGKDYVEIERQMLPHLGLDIDQSKIVPLQSAAMQIAESNPGDKWL